MENQTYAWEPLQQFENAWMLTAIPHAVQVIFWMCVVKATFSAMSMLSGIDGLWSKDDAAEANMTNKMTHYKNKTDNTTKRSTFLHSRNILQLVVAILGILLGIFAAILLDSQEVFKAFCIAIVFYLVIIGFSVCFVLLPILTVMLMRTV